MKNRRGWKCAESENIRNGQDIFFGIQEMHPKVPLTHPAANYRIVGLRFVKLCPTGLGIGVDEQHGSVWELLRWT